MDLTFQASDVLLEISDAVFLGCFALEIVRFLSPGLGQVFLKDRKLCKIAIVVFALCQSVGEILYLPLKVLHSLLCGLKLAISAVRS